MDTLVGCIESGADVNGRDLAGNTPLHRLAWSGRPSSVAQTIVRMLAAAGADVNARNDDGATPLHFATGAGRSAVAAELLEAGAEVNVHNGPGRTPLHRAAAAKGDQVELVRLLAGAGAFLDAPDERGRTPLHYALDRENPGVFAALVELGSDPTLPDDNGNLPDPASCRRSNTRWFWGAAGVDAVGDCVRLGADVTELLQVASKFTRDPAMISLLVEAGADINARNGRSETPLHLASRHNANPAVLAALLDAGAEVNTWGVDWSTPAGMPVERERRTILHSAAEWNANPEIVSVLLAAGADVNARMKSGSAPLHLAARHNANPAVIEALVSGGADVNAPVGGGSTPLHLAALHNADVFPVLLELGADLAALDDAGRTPAELARNDEELRQLEIVRRSPLPQPES